MRNGFDLRHTTTSHRLSFSELFIRSGTAHTYACVAWWMKHINQNVTRLFPRNQTGLFEFEFKLWYVVSCALCMTRNVDMTHSVRLCDMRKIHVTESEEVNEWLIWKCCSCSQARSSDLSVTVSCAVWRLIYFLASFRDTKRFGNTSSSAEKRRNSRSSLGFSELWF